MRNPYEVLGIREGTDIEGIKRAYKELVKKYHPDQYMNNPLSDLAEEKLKEINQAYDYLIKKAEADLGSRRSTQSDFREAQNNGYQNSSDRSYYDQVRSYININKFAAAENLLSQAGNRDGEWYYLYGLVCMRKGWYNDALTSLRTAVNMEPNNFEYREALNRVMNSNRQYQSTVYQRRGYNSGPDMCSLCQCMICTDCCCECMGSDFISCC